MHFLPRNQQLYYLENSWKVLLRYDELSEDKIIEGVALVRTQVMCWGWGTLILDSFTWEKAFCVYNGIREFFEDWFETGNRSPSKVSSFV